LVGAELVEVVVVEDRGARGHRLVDPQPALAGRPGLDQARERGPLGGQLIDAVEPAVQPRGGRDARRHRAAAQDRAPVGVARARRDLALQALVLGGHGLSREGLRRRSPGVTRPAVIPATASASARRWWALSPILGRTARSLASTSSSVASPRRTSTAAATVADRPWPNAQWMNAAGARAR